MKYTFFIHILYIFKHTTSDSDGYEKFIEKETDIIENVKDQEKSKEAYVHCNSEQIELGKTVHYENAFWILTF